MKTPLRCLLLLAAAPAGANPVVHEMLNVRPTKGCEVEVRVSRFKGLKAATLRRARASYALQAAACRLDVRTFPRTERARRDYGYGSPRVGAESYDAVTFTDTVCGDGFWSYALFAEGEANEDFDDRQAQEVEVKGCAPKAGCSPQLDAPAALRVVEPATPCQPNWDFDLRVGDDRTEHVREDLGTLIRGQGVVEVSGKSPNLRFRALKPGVAWFQGKRGADGDLCARIEVKPVLERGKATLEQRRAFAFYKFEPPDRKEERIIPLAPGAQWPVPLRGTLELDRYHTMVRPTVDEQCRPMLLARRSGNENHFSGAQLTEPNGAAHRYIFNLTGNALELNCVVSQSLELEEGLPEQVPARKLTVLGDDLIRRLPDGVVLPLKPGVMYVAEAADSDDCGKITVVPAITSREERIKRARERAMDRTDSPVTVVELKVGEKKELPGGAFSGLTGGNWAVVRTELLKKKHHLVGLRKGYTGFTVQRTAGPSDFVLVEVK